MLDVLIKPGKFFEERMEKEERLVIPALIVLLSGVFGGISSFLMASKTMPLISEEFASLISIGALISAILFSFVLWLLISAIFYGISAVFGGTGDFKRTLELVGYGFIPAIFGGIISAALTYEVISTLTITPPHIPAEAPPQEVSLIIQEWSEKLARSLKQNPIYMMSSAIGILFTIWSANIWIFAMKHARKLTTRNAVITVMIPVSVYIAYSAWQLIA